MRIALLFFAAPLLAHDLYLLPRQFVTKPGEPLLVSIHNGDAFPKSDDAIDPARVLGGQLYDLRSLGHATHGFAKLDTPGTHWISIYTEPRLLELPAARFETYLKDEGLDSIVAWRAEHGESQKDGREMYSKFAKTLVVAGAPDAGWRKLVGLTLEIVPDADPRSLRPGAILPVRVLWRGKPANDLKIEAASDTGVVFSVRTDDEGKASIVIPAAGRWRLHTVAMERASDWASFWSSLTFECRP